MIPDLSGGALAQLVEHLTFNQVVGRSSRPRPTTFSPYFNSLSVYSTPSIYTCLHQIRTKYLAKPMMLLPDASRAGYSAATNGKAFLLSTLRHCSH